MRFLISNITDRWYIWILSSLWHYIWTPAHHHYPLGEAKDILNYWLYVHHDLIPRTTTQPGRPVRIAQQYAWASVKQWRSVKHRWIVPGERWLAKVPTPPLGLRPQADISVAGGDSVVPSFSSSWRWPPWDSGQRPTPSYRLKARFGRPRPSHMAKLVSYGLPLKIVPPGNGRATALRLFREEQPVGRGIQAIGTWLDPMEDTEICGAKYRSICWSIVPRLPAMKVGH